MPPLHANDTLGCACCCFPGLLWLCRKALTTFALLLSLHPLPLQEAKYPFLIADAILLVALHFVDRGLKAEKKLLELEGHRGETRQEMIKDAKLAQQAKQRAEQKAGNKHDGSKPANGGKKFHIQQPSKRD